MTCSEETVGLSIREYKATNVNFQCLKSNWTVSNHSCIVLHHAVFSWSEKLFRF